MGIDDTTLATMGQDYGKRHLPRSSTSLVIAILSKPVDCAGARLMLLVDIPWAHRVWALPFFTVLAPPSGIINLIDIGIKPHRANGRCWLKCDDGCRTERLSWLPIVVLQH